MKFDTEKCAVLTHPIERGKVTQSKGTNEPDGTSISLLKKGEKLEYLGVLKCYSQMKKKSGKNTYNVSNMSEKLCCQNLIQAINTVNIGNVTCLICWGIITTWHQF